MKVIQPSDYRIYFDDVRMDPYIKNWSGGVGLRASDAAANVTMYRTKKLEEWKGYLTQVRIFVLNIFSGKYDIIFEGELMNRSWGDSRNDTGEITFNCKGFYHWLNLPIPLQIGWEEQIDHIRRFQYEAQNIDVEAFMEVFSMNSDILMKDKSLEEILDTLFENMYKGYSLSEDSSFEFAKLRERFKVMGEVIKEFREAGFLDAVTFTRTTQIDSFYVYLNQILTQLMFEFYQDRDGAFRIKPPSWSDDILKAHVLDEAVVQTSSGFNDWENEPTRVLVIGGETDWGRTGTPQVGAGNTIEIPMGLYIGQPGNDDYYSQNVSLTMGEFGTDPGQFTEGGMGNVDGSATAAAYYLNENEFRVTTPFAPGGVNDGWHESGHFGIDLARPEKGPNAWKEIAGKAVYSLTDGNVVNVFSPPSTAGYACRIKAPSGHELAYNHLIGAPSVKVGDVVSAGQQIGGVGNTGRSGGNHLDLKVKNPSGEYIDPIPYLQQMAQGGTASAGAGSSTSTGGTTPSNAAGELRGYNGSTLWTGQYADIINANAKANNIEPFLIAAIIQQESKFNKGATSPAGARGLMQMMPATARGLGVTNAYDPADNVRGGSKYIRQMIDKFKNLKLALAAYNAGPGNVQKYGNQIPPFTETQNYVKKVTGYLNEFRSGNTGGTVGSGATDTASSAGQASPNAATGGFTVKTAYSTHYYKSLAEKEVANKVFSVAKKDADKKIIPVKYKDASHFKMMYPTNGMAKDVRDYILTMPNGMEHDLIAVTIEKASNWSAKNKVNGRYGLMGVNEKYVSGMPGLDEKMMYDPLTNLQHGTMLFNNAYVRFDGKVSLALAALHIGGMLAVEEAVTKAGSQYSTSAFYKVKEFLPADTGAFVDSVLEEYTSLHSADYIEGDPHFPILENGTLTGPIDKAAVDELGKTDYETSYKPVLSDEERLYKLSLKISEQKLIRYDVERNKTQTLNADEMVERYAKYMMQLFRAESHGVTVNLATCLPFLRPGFNAWLEPTRRNLVFYMTRITHQGSYGNGAFTTINGAFVRDPKTYHNIEQNIFVATNRAKPSEFGETLARSNMDSLMFQLRTLHANTERLYGDARTIPTLSKLYSSANASSESDYVTTWTGSMTAAQIEEKIAAIYKTAPPIIQTRKTELRALVKEAASFFTETLLRHSYK